MRIGDLCERFVSIGCVMSCHVMSSPIVSFTYTGDGHDFNV